MITTDANNAVASVAYRVNEVIAIYPITPSSTMAEQAKTWFDLGTTNIWGDIPRVVEMQSEAGAIATVHGAIQTGALSTSFTSSQGLLLMIPTLYKIAGQLMPFVLHVAARTIATHALSIFGDHSDVMSVRQTGCAMLCASNVQEAQDFALIAQIASLNSRLPFIHFFDGFRTSHEITKIVPISDDTLKSIIPHAAIDAHRSRALTPDRPVIRGTSANPDTYFQTREATNSWYKNAFYHVQQAMNSFATSTGRQYNPFEYYGHIEADRLIIIMGSAIGTCKEVIDYLLNRNEKVGMVKVRLYRPFSATNLLAIIPTTVQAVAVLDRTKEPGALAEPLYLDVMTALAESYSLGQRKTLPRTIGGRYGLASKEFDPACVIAIFTELTLLNPRKRFTVGIFDDVTQLSLSIPDNPLPRQAKLEALFYGLGSDGSVSAVKNNIKIIGNNTSLFVQGYFVYDSKKAGSLTVSHLRISHKPINSAYLVNQADYISCNQYSLLNKYHIISRLRPRGIFLMNTSYSYEEVWIKLPQEVQLLLVQRQARFYVINAQKIALECKLGNRINTIMQIAFFQLTNILTIDQAQQALQQAVITSYSHKGQEWIKSNLQAIKAACNALIEVPLGHINKDSPILPPIVSNTAPNFVKTVTAVILAGLGDTLPVSAFPPDGTWPIGTARWEKRNIAETIPIWTAELCTQCNYCVAACPHAAIRAKVVAPTALDGAPTSLKFIDAKMRHMYGQKYLLQVAPEDCTGCGLCVKVCPARDRKNREHKAINMVSHLDFLQAEKTNYDFFLNLPEINTTILERIDIRTSQLITPLFEYSGACSGCGETPYIKILTQLYGDRLLIANATGCSSIYSGNLPTTPYTTKADGRGPAWANSLFEDNAEFGLGFRLTIDQHRKRVLRLLNKHRLILPPLLFEGLCATDTSVEERRKQIAELRILLNKLKTKNTEVNQLYDNADYLVDKSIWLIGGDGWAYDIGFGGLDHVLSLTENINILVLDTQCYSNTGGHQSKATPLGAVTKFCEQGKLKARKDLGISMIMYGHIYVAQISLGANMNHSVKTIQEAETYPGPSLIIAYCPCEAHGYDLALSHIQMQKLTAAGFWPLYRFDPRRYDEGKLPLILDSRLQIKELSTILLNEQRFRRSNVNLDIEREIKQKYEFLARMAGS
ncbi:pyruvate:ferredoxin (flavodoxin) oxidoreductase [Candidatus Palibaumannia cicadellinicola]|uniref:Pyruvate-flavodoxin oxidoreductase n=1 Tax=Baumannia cicadellinicola subsp. Homalodisca coagulata TaxID=374463 RepID=Q1LT53_BAUCH|nr:pyruvate:ferredoxin (flavodoxin) oxidoreductase [Candidatus Baumannia cicadellinicola]ABF14304.1 Pyruvate-flavodoxin oxidoreductase [Baumannia cicadellinicola str. Hc (Homalodisca coagulata)]MBS0032813.1 pyruvate:ferredoxin (flavodoxin) oxidoreductase [Candidatus Baumannia cicadellinicola]MBS0032842.1 pyruvate:ferredoxin (flavodoxin) oxidoreductase [Candidatus Baumannia cicadellinicola]MCJ7462099.1 pyruvate:ferredoxin (flavodoxin) oxidoreductase [Candidatus Baumannia cicadellinicola]MCJ7462